MGANKVVVSAVRLNKTPYQQYSRAVATWVRPVEAAPAIVNGTSYEQAISWTTGTAGTLKTYSVGFKAFEDIFAKSAVALSWGTAAVSTAAALYL